MTSLISRRARSLPAARHAGLAALVLACASSPSRAQDGGGASAAELQNAIDLVQTPANILGTLVAACWVFWMQAGFVFVESGFTRAKNAAHIMRKNLLDMSLRAMSFRLIGLGIMFGAANGLFGMDRFLLSSDNAPGGGQWAYTFWMFQVVFAATAATIVSGALAERTRCGAYLLYSVAVTAIIYPVCGHWGWGSLLLDQASRLAARGFIDFAGSPVVHSVGGWAALAGAIVVGPCLGKLTKSGKAGAIPGHKMATGALAVFIPFLGWFGFNAGSAATADGLTARIAVSTCLAACAGAVLAMLTPWWRFKEPDVGMPLTACWPGWWGSLRRALALRPSVLSSSALSREFSW